MKIKVKTKKYNLKYVIKSTDPRLVNDVHGILSELKPSKKDDRWLVQREFTESEARLTVMYETKSRLNVRLAKFALDVLYKTLKFKYDI
jgi:hypothetical protein